MSAKRESESARESEREWEGGRAREGGGEGAGRGEGSERRDLLVLEDTFLNNRVYFSREEDLELHFLNDSIA